MQKTKRSKKNGFSLVEVLVALALMAIVGGGFLMVLANSSSHTLNSDNRATAESIARTQMEYVKSLAYDGSDNPPVYTPAALAAPLNAANWKVLVAAVRLDPKNDGISDDDGTQKITVTVQFNQAGTWKTILTLDGYKYSG